MDSMEKARLDGATITVCPPQRVPKVRIKTRAKGMTLSAWVEYGKHINAARRLDPPGKYRGTYTRKDVGKCHVVKR